MIPPRRNATSADPLLVTGVLGAAALLGQLRTLLAELAADGDSAAESARTDDAHAGAADPGAIVDVVLGLAALAAAIDRQLPAPRTAPAAVDPGEPRELIHLLVKELLR